MDGQTIGGMLRDAARENPDKLFATCDGSAATYDQLDARAGRLAAGFARLGVHAGDRVAVLAPNRWEWIELYFALAKAGIIQVPINTFLKGEFLRYQLENSDPVALVTDAAGLEAARDLLPALPGVTTLITLDGGGDPVPGLTTVPYADLASDDEFVEPGLGPSDVMSIVYTSGTTGLPKGCILSHGYYLRVGLGMCTVNDIRSQDVLFTALPLFHSAARMMVVAAALQARATVAIDTSFSASNFFRNAAAVGATKAYGVGAMSVALAKSAVSEHDRAHTVGLVMLPPTVPATEIALSERFGAQFWSESYGQTECVPITNNPSFSAEKRPGASGRMVDDLEGAIMDSDDLALPAGQTGELCIRPKTPWSMFSGYWRNPEATLDAYRHLWYHTGDTGYFDDEGFFHYVDRKKDAMRRRGENVSSSELEAAIALHPDIEDVAVVGVAAESDQDIKACIVPVTGRTLEPAALFEFFTKNLPYFAVPRYVELLDALPKTPTGRNQKFLLRDRPMTEATWDFTALGLEQSKENRR